MLIAGMVPIALGQGPGSASRASMAKVIVGGQALSLLLSLLVTPVAYSLFDDLSMWWRRKRSRTLSEQPSPAHAAHDHAVGTALAQPAELAQPVA